MRQRLGQHFLIKDSILDKIAASACPVREPVVIEIGPGKGALTGRLLERADRVVAIELDEELAVRLRGQFPDPRLEIVSAGVLETDLAQWGPAVVAGNLPYYIATAIFSRVIAPGSTLARGVFLMQKEVAQRIAAAPGCRDYGYLSVESQLLADVKELFDVGPSAFRPPPKVESALIGFKLAPLRAAELGIESPHEFLKFVRLCFRQKRKTIRNNLAAAYGSAALAEMPEARLRAEQIPLARFAALYRSLVG